MKVLKGKPSDRLDRLVVKKAKDLYHPRSTHSFHVQSLQNSTMFPRTLIRIAEAESSQTPFGLGMTSSLSLREENDIKVAELLLEGHNLFYRLNSCSCLC